MNQTDINTDDQPASSNAGEPDSALKKSNNMYDIVMPIMYLMIVFIVGIVLIVFYVDLG